MKVWGLILGVAIVFVISDDTFAWKDKSKTSSDRDSSHACSLRCKDTLNAAQHRCEYIWNSTQGEYTGGTNRCLDDATKVAQSCERNCQNAIKIAIFATGRRAILRG
jgi:hypothetical protein